MPSPTLLLHFFMFVVAAVSVAKAATFRDHHLRLPTDVISAEPPMTARTLHDPTSSIFAHGLAFLRRLQGIATPETTDGDALCNYYSTATSKYLLLNWCGSKSNGNYINGPCTGTWRGIRCTNGRVSSFDTSPYEIGGTLPSSLGGLNALTYLDVSSTLLSGNIPSSLGALTGLILLTVGSNRLTGTIPSSLGGLTALTYLDLSSNSLSGTIPSSLGALTGLTGFYLNTNVLTGSLPFSFCSLKATISLLVSGSAGLTCYPSCLSTNTKFSKPPAMWVCAPPPTPQPTPLPTTAITPSPTPQPTPQPTVMPSPVPSSITAQPTSTPTVIPTPPPSNFPTPEPTSTPTAIPTPSPTSTSFETADGDALCSSLHISATTPSKLTNWCGAKSNGNYVNGPCTGTSGRWLGVTCTSGRVTKVDLSYVGMGGTIPSSLGDLTLMTFVSLRSNNLVGTLPSSLGALTGLIWLDLGSNADLTGSIPSSFGALTGLNTLYLNANGLTGPLPNSFCSLKITSIDISVQNNPGLTCFPSCLSTNLDFVVGKGTTWQCTAAPTPQPTRPTAMPTLAPSAMPSTVPTRIPTTIPSPVPSTNPTPPPTRIPTAIPTPAPSVKLTSQPSSIPTPQPSAVPTYHRLQFISQTVASIIISATTASYTVPDAAFNNLNDGTGLRWYLTIEAYGTGWGSSDPYANFFLVGAAGGTTSLAQYCNPGNACGGSRTYASPLGPFRCVMNYPVTTANMNAANGGSIVIKATTNFASTSCLYQGSNVVFNYTLSATNPQASYAPSQSPTSAPFAGAVSPPTLPPTSQPTSPSPAPSALPTTVPSPSPSGLPTPLPSAAPSFFPTHQSGSTVVKNAFSNTPGTGSAGFVIPPVVFTNLLADTGRVWYLRVEALPLGWGASNYVTIKIIGASGLLTQSKCHPGSACTTLGYYPSHAVPTRCIMGWELLPSDLDPAQGGSITVTAFTTNFQASECTYASQNVYLTYTLTAGFALPTYFPTAAPSAQPTVQPTVQPSALPTAPTPEPSARPTVLPSAFPSSLPTTKPSPEPSMRPSALPSANPTMRSDEPTPDPTARPTQPSAQPTVQATALPTVIPSALPTFAPTTRPSPEPTAAPSVLPSMLPSAKPSPEPTMRPSALPSARPTAVPSAAPTHRPTALPTVLPTARPTRLPSAEPTDLPTVVPSSLPTAHPTYSARTEISPVFRYAKTANDGVFATEPYTFTNLDAKGKISAWYLNVFVFGSGFGAEGKVFVTLTGYSVGGKAGGSSGRMLGNSDVGSLPFSKTFKCTPPPGLCSEDGVPAPYRCPDLTNFEISPAQLSGSDGGSFSIVANTKNANHDVDCPYNDHSLYVKYSLSTHGSPTQQPSLQPTTAAPNLALLIANQQQAQGLNDVVMSKGAPMYAVGGGAAVFALVAMLLFQVRDQVVVDASAGRRGSRTSRDLSKTDKHASVAVVKLNLVATIVGSALTGAAFVSEFFLIQLLFASDDTAILGYVAILGRLVHFAAAMLIYLLISKSRTRRVFNSIRPLKPLYSTAIYKANLKLFGLLFLLSMCDCTLLRFLPWRDSKFARETSGYPSPFVFLSLVYTKLLQSALTVSCQALLLMNLLKIFKGGALSPSLAFLALNMAVTVAMLLVNLLEAGLRTGLLSGLTAADEEDIAALSSHSFHASQPSHELIEMAHVGATNPLHESYPVHTMTPLNPYEPLGHVLSAEQSIDTYEGYTGYSPDIATWDRRSLSASPEHDGKGLDQALWHGQEQGQGRLSVSKLPSRTPSAIFDHTVASMYHPEPGRPGWMSQSPSASPALARLPLPGAFSPSLLPAMGPMHHMAPGRIDISKRASLAAAPLPPMLQPRAGFSHAGSVVEAAPLAQPHFSRPQPRHSHKESSLKTRRIELN